MGIPISFASFERAIMQPSLLLKTHTALFAKSGFISCSQETKKLLQSTSAISAMV